MCGKFSWFFFCWWNIYGWSGELHFLDNNLQFTENCHVLVDHVINISFFFRLKTQQNVRFFQQIYCARLKSDAEKTSPTSNYITKCLYIRTNFTFVWWKNMNSLPVSHGTCQRPSSHHPNRRSSAAASLAGMVTSAVVEYWTPVASSHRMQNHHSRRCPTFPTFIYLFQWGGKKYRPAPSHTRTQIDYFECE